MAIEVLRPALQARLPDSDLWFRAARLLDLAREWDESTRAYGRAAALGLGRSDARLGALAQLARRRPAEAAREFARLVDEHPEDLEARKGLVLALVRADKIGAADRVLSELVTEHPEDPEVPLLTAEVKAAKGEVRAARSLYNAVLRDDPLALDARATRAMLRDSHEWGVSTGYEYDLRQDNTGTGIKPEDWQEFYVAAFWRQPIKQTFNAEYHWYQRSGGTGSQLLGDWLTALDRRWIARLNAGAAVSGDVTSKWRAGAGANYRFQDNCFGVMDVKYLRFSDVNVVQLVPSLIWQWHPRGTLETRLYLSENMFDVGGRETGFTWVINNAWQLGRQSSFIVHYAVGNEDNLDPVRETIGEDQFQGGGVAFRLGWRHRWSVEPAYRFEAHETYLLHGFSLGVSCRF